MREFNQKKKTKFGFGVLFACGTAYRSPVNKFKLGKHGAERRFMHEEFYPGG
jgi:hypothetical protein